MSDLTPEVLNELERLENSATPGPWQSNGYYDRSRAMLRPSHAIWTKDPPDDASPEEWANQKAIARPFDGLPSHQCDEATAGINMDLLAALRNHARDLIEAARERDRLDRLLKTEIADNCEYDTEIRAMCGHVDDQYREPLPDVVQKVVDERDRLREVLSFYADRSNWTTPDQVNLDELFNTAMSADSHGERARQALERKDGD